MQVVKKWEQKTAPNLKEMLFRCLYNQRKSLRSTGHLLTIPKLKEPWLKIRINFDEHDNN